MGGGAVGDKYQILNESQDLYFQDAPTFIWKI